MVVIRMSRGGSRKRPFYNIIATDRRNRRDGRFIERIGFYNPMAAGQEMPLRIATERLDYWRANGAQVSASVERLARQAANSAPQAEAAPQAESAAQAESA